MVAITLNSICYAIRLMALDFVLPGELNLPELRISRARSAGFCFGVRGALELAGKALKEHGEVCSLGELIHNPDVVASLRDKGVHVIEDLGEARGRPVLIRSHGVAPEIFEQAREQGMVIVDATCPFVRRVQERAEDLTGQGYQVVVIGSSEHPEVRGILGWTGYKASVVYDPEEIERLPHAERIGVLSQTTQTRDRVNLIARELVGKALEVRIYDTICRASLARQEEAAAIAAQVDMMVVIGGRNSANTCKLAEICRQYVPTLHVENAAEIEQSMFEGVSSVGVTAGASTPDWIIEEVIGGMSMFGEDPEATSVGPQEPSQTAPRESDPQHEAVTVDTAATSTAAESTAPSTATAAESTATSTDTAAESTDTAAESTDTAAVPTADEPVSPEAGGEPEQSLSEAAPEAKLAVAEAEPEPVAEAAPEAEPRPQAEAVQEPEQEEMMNLDLAGTPRQIQQGECLSGTVVQVREDEVLIDIGGKSEGVIPRQELSLKSVDHPNEIVKEGDVIDVFVLRADNDEGHLILSKKRADRAKAMQDVEQALDTKVELVGEVLKVVKGGLLVDVGMRGFVPASLVERGYVGDLEKYVGNTLRLRVIEFDKSRGKVVLSQKAILQDEYIQAQKELWETIQPGEIRKGVVRHLTNFGAFVDLGGVDGLLHISELSWGRIKHPSEVVQEGVDVEVYVISVDRDNKRISLSLKQARENPWNTVDERYQVGQIVKGTIVRLVSFGAFVEIEPGVEGLVHISRLADFRVAKPEDVISAGQEIDVKILDINKQDQRISLSIKDAAKERGSGGEDADPKDEADAKPTPGNDPEVSLNLGDMFGDLFTRSEQK
jgi:(E)-4-hydroxy-3-methyl-but-2-enyl pyrophosphate reductase